LLNGVFDLNWVTALCCWIENNLFNISQEILNNYLHQGKQVKLSPYDPRRIEEIKALFTKTFSDSEGQSEGELIGNLVYELMTGTDSHDLYGFVATEKNKIVGSIFFSKITFESKINAFILSPAAIHTDFQKQGIGQKLIKFGLNTLKECGIELIFTYGDPNFYTKVGFKPVTEKQVKAPFKLTYPEGWLGLSLVSKKIESIAGNSYCVEALNNPQYW